MYLDKNAVGVPRCFSLVRFLSSIFYYTLQHKNRTGRMVEPYQGSAISASSLAADASTVNFFV